MYIHISICYWIKSIGNAARFCEICRTIYFLVLSVSIYFQFCFYYSLSNKKYICFSKRNGQTFPLLPETGLFDKTLRKT